MNKKFLIILLLFIFAITLLFSFKSRHLTSIKQLKVNKAPVISSSSTKPETPLVNHIKTPENVRGIYMTSWVAGTLNFRNDLVKVLDETAANSVVIDIKDDTGRVTFDMPAELVKKEGSIESRVKDMPDFIKTLHEKDVYVIGRIAVFQDPYYALRHPESSIKFASNGEPWKDRKGQMWIDASDKTFWKYIADMARGAHAVGFDEIQFDYIRFPTDGRISDIAYPISKERITQAPETAKMEIIESFARFLSAELRKDFPISADIFGIVVTDYSDNNIGQYLEKLLPHFDFISPMIYPSHFANGYAGFPNPAASPYGVIHASMSSAVNRRNEFLHPAVTPSSTEKIKGATYAAQYRPWLQDFDIGADYNNVTVYEQIKALNDLGVKSWLMWAPSNRYSIGALRE